MLCDPQLVYQFMRAVCLQVPLVGELEHIFRDDATASAGQAVPILGWNVRRPVDLSPLRNSDRSLQFPLKQDVNGASWHTDFDNVTTTFHLPGRFNNSSSRFFEYELMFPARAASIHVRIQFRQFNGRHILPQAL